MVLQGAGTNRTVPADDRTVIGAIYCFSADGAMLLFVVMQVPGAPWCSVFPLRGGDTILLNRGEIWAQTPASYTVQPHIAKPLQIMCYISHRIF